MYLKRTCTENVLVTTVLDHAHSPRTYHEDAYAGGFNQHKLFPVKDPPPPERPFGAGGGGFLCPWHHTFRVCRARTFRVCPLCRLCRGGGWGSVGLVKCQPTFRVYCVRTFRVCPLFKLCRADTFSVCRARTFRVCRLLRLCRGGG